MPEAAARVPPNSAPKAKDFGCAQPHPSRPFGLSTLLEHRRRLRVAAERPLAVTCERLRFSGPFEETGPVYRVDSELRGAMEVGGGPPSSGEGEGARARLDQGLLGFRRDRSRVRRVRLGLNSVRVVRGEHIGDLFRLLAPCSLQMLGRPQVPLFSIVAARAPVSNALDKRLGKPVLPALRRIGIVVQRQNCLPTSDSSAARHPALSAATHAR